MAAPLIAISFLCAILLAVFIPVRRIYADIPSLAIILWLCAGNIIHAVNAIMWADNTNTRTPIWCDISSKLILGVSVAVPGAFVCVARHLELISSSRKIPVGPNVKRNYMIFEILCCYVLPIVYMALHIISQDHRFDIAQDFGCVAAVHPSTPALVAVWTPPLVLCAIALFLCGLSVHNSVGRSTAGFSSHLADRTSTRASYFFRRLVTAMIMTGVAAITALFSLFSIPILQPWLSWASVHVDLAEVNIVTLPDEISTIRLNWWTLSALSIIYAVLAFVIGEEARDSYKWLVKQYMRRDRFFEWCRSLFIWPSRDILPHAVNNRSRSQSSNAPPSPALPHMVELKSGWDDMIDFKSSKGKGSSKQSVSCRSSNSSPSASPVSSRSPSAASFRANTNVSANTNMTTADQAFMNSTLSYLGSPTAQTLGIASPIAAPSPVLVVPRKPAPPALLLATGDPVLPLDDISDVRSPAIRSPHPSKAIPRISSVFEAQWPVPPSSPSPVGSMASRHSSRSPTHSPCSSCDDDTVSYSLSHARSPSKYRYIRPFEDASVSSVCSVPGALPSHSVVRTPSLKQSLQSLRSSWDRKRHASGLSQTDVIHMMVVQETV